MNEIDLKEIDVLKDAITKHNLRSLDDLDEKIYENLKALVRYALHVGYSEGYQDAAIERSHRE
jgi:hypothetical protein